jgi:hypothetical protein
VFKHTAKNIGHPAATCAVAKACTFNSAAIAIQCIVFFVSNPRDTVEKEIDVQTRKIVDRPVIFLEFLQNKIVIFVTAGMNIAETVIFSQKN